MLNFHIIIIIASLRTLKHLSKIKNKFSSYYIKVLQEYDSSFNKKCNFS